MLNRIILSFVCVMVGICFAQQALGNSLERMLESAKNYYNNGEYEKAINELEKALQYLKQLEQSDQVEAYKYLGFSYVAFGDNAKAKQVFKKALTLDPQLELNPATVSPKIIKVFEEAKSEMASAPIPSKPPVVEPVKPGEINTFGATWRSCCFPGWGQMYKGEGGKGKKIMIASGITFSAALISLIIQKSAHDKYLDVEAGDIHEMDQAYKNYKFWYNVSALTVITFLGVYVYNIYDVVFTEAKIKSSMLDLNNGFYCNADKDRVQFGYNINF